MSLKDRISEDLTKALAARETERLSAVRLIRAEILKAEKEKGIPVDDAKVVALLQAMLKQRRDSITQFEAASREDLAAKERSEMAVIAGYLPEAISETEIATTIDATLAEMRAAAGGTLDAKSQGKAIGAVMARLKATGKPFDAQAVQTTIRSKLN